MTRPTILDGKTEKIRTGCGNFYITITLKDNKPFEVFAHLGKAGGCASSQTESLARLISLSLRNGISTTTVVKQLKNIQCNVPSGQVTSCADAIAKVLERYINNEGEEG